MNENASSNAEKPLAEGRTNPNRGSTVDALVDPKARFFYRPETNELLVVPIDTVTLFENECRILDQLMWAFQDAKEQCLQAQEKLLTAQRLKQDAQGQTQVAVASRVVKAAQANLAMKQQAVENEFKPLGKLDDTDGKLYELIPVKKKKSSAGSPGKAKHPGHVWGRKWTYVRSDKIKSHFRSYALNGDEKGVYQGAPKNSAIKEDGSIDTDKLKKQFSKLETSVEWKKEIDTHGVLLKDFNEKLHQTLEGWANALNQGNQHLELGFEAQVMRYFAGAGISAEWDPLGHGMAVRAEARAEFAIGEAKADLASYWPSRGGYMLQIIGPQSGKVYSAGLIRLGAKIELTGLAGASACGQLALEVDYSDDRQKAGVRGKASRTPLTALDKPVNSPASDDDQNLSKFERYKQEMDTKVDLFAGARAECAISGALQWNSPESQSFDELCAISQNIQGQWGAGIAGQFNIDYRGGKFRLLAAAAVCLGAGGGGKLEFEVDAGNTLKFTGYLAYLLYSADYELLEIITGDGFNAWKNLILWSIQAGQKIDAAVNTFLGDFYKAYSEFSTKLKQENERINLINNVLSNPKELEYAPPEAKGILLYYLLAQPDGISDVNALSRCKEAVLIVCKKARSKTELRNICQHMTADGSSGATDWQTNHQQLMAYQPELAGLYERLYDAPVLGYAFVDNDTPDYVARTESHPGYLMAGGYDPGPEIPEFDSDNNSAPPQYI
jgi:hypothetical protein